MIHIKVMLLCLYTLFALNISASRRNWRGLVPLVSTRVDVERLLGSPVNSCRLERCSYETKDEHVSVTYSNGTCVDQESSYNVSRGTVLSIDVTPKKKLLPSELQLDLSKYEKFDDHEILGLVHYDNAEEGLYFAVDLGEVQEMIYFPMKKDDYLRCPRPKASPSKKTPRSKVEGGPQLSGKHRRRCYH